MTKNIALLCAPFVIACQPHVELDGSRVSSLKRAASLAAEGSVITLSGGDHLGGIVLPDAVTLRGEPGAVIQTNATRAIDGLGGLLLEDLTLLGGVDDDGAVIRTAGSLSLARVSIRGGQGSVAVQVSADLDFVDSEIFHTDVALQVFDRVGRPATVHIEGGEIDGQLDVEAESLTVRDLDGDHLRATGRALLLQDTTWSTLEVQAAQLIAAGVELTGSAWLLGGEALIAEADGGTWQLDLQSLTAADWTVSAIAGSTERAYLDAVDAPLLLLDGGFIDVRDVRSQDVDLQANGLVVENLRGTNVTLYGFGSVTHVGLVGDSPSLLLGPVQAAGIVVHATAGTARVQLEGTQVSGLLVVEPQTASGDTVIASNTFADVRHFTFLGGHRTAILPELTAVGFFDSILAGVDLGTIDPEAGYTHTVLWHLDGSIDPTLAAYPGIDPMDPRFSAAGDPTLAPDSPFLHRGAFAAPPAAAIESLWNALN